MLCLLLFLSACGATGSTTAPHPGPPIATQVATQPVTAQQVLSGPTVYVALGASDAVGVGSKQPGSQGYVPLIAQHLYRGSHLINLGVSGIRLHAALDQELPLALNTAPQLITIWLVANDFVANVPYDSYMHDLNTLLQRLRTGTRARIVMANLPDLTRLPAFANLSTAQKQHMLAGIQHWNAGIATIAQRYIVTLVDLYSHNSQLTSHPEYISADGFHPSPAGYNQLANYFWQGITSAS